MKILDGYLSLKKGAVLTIGNFDGIHKGHQKIIKKNVEISKKNNLKSVVITFDPHPKEFFNKNKSSFKLTKKNTKIDEIKKLGVDYLIFKKFNKNFAKLSPEEFIKKISILNQKFIVVGYNFCFGYKRKGNVNLLKKLSKKYLYKLKVISRVLNKNKKTINSTLIRKKIKTGDYNKVKDMLGRNWLLEGKVIRGSGRGKSLGYPTANFFIKDYVLPMKGVYITKSFFKNNKKAYYGIANIGNRPTFNEKKVFFENHFFKINNNFYGKEIFVELLAFLRKEKKFYSIDLLKKQIKKDVLLAKKYIK
tara:strand:+ start:2488 stop:3402 length:915 start_codon:yes stop_codon:yes gene_type:complete